MCKLLVLRRDILGYNCLLKIIIISYLKLYTCLQIIGVK